MLFGVDGRQLITVAGSIVRIWPLESDPEPDARFDHPFPIWRLVASADGQRAVTVCAARSVDTQAEVRIWDLANGRLIGEPFKPAVGGIGLTVSPDNRHAILSVSRAQNNVEFFLGDLQSGEWRPLPRPNIYMSPYFSPGGRYLLRVQPMSKSADVSYQLIETASGRDVSDLLQGRQPAMGAVRLDSKSCWAPDDRRIVVRADAGVQVWDLDKREAVTPVLRHEGGIAAGGTFSQDGLRIISDSNERTDVRLWDALTGAPLGPQVQLIPDRAQVDEVYWQRSPDGRRLLVWGSYATTPLPVRLWDLTAGKYLELPGVVDLGDFHGQGFSPDGQRVLAKTANGLRVFDAVAGTPLTPEMTPGPPYQIRDHFGYGRAISGRFSPDGRFVLTEVPTQIWDAASGLPLTAPFPAGVKVSDNVPVLNLDGSTIVVPSSPTTLSIFRLHVREKNLDELAALAETIGARRLTASGTMQALEPDQVAAGWHAFRNTALPARGGEATEWHRRRIARLGYDQRTELLRGRGLGAITTLHEFTRATRPLNLLEQSNAFAARWHFDRLLALERNPNAVANRAFAHFVLRDWDKAVADFDEAIAAGVPDLWGARGEAQAERGKFREAQADFEKAVPKQREPLGLLVKLAHVQAELRDDARLQVTCAKIRPHLSNHKPEYSHSHVLLRALALGDSRDPEFAEFVKSFENFWLPLKNRRDWDRGTALFGIGMARYRLGDYDAAFAALSEAEPFLVGDQRPFGLLPLAATCLKTNRAKEAREWLDKVEPSAYESTSLLWHERLELKRWRREVDELIKPDG
jgi:WD40 repeat protein/tetratricopeptide (TPR) repeat protein